MAFVIVTARWGGRPRLADSFEKKERDVGVPLYGR